MAVVSRGVFCPRCGLQEGFLLSPDGALLDNRDGFYDHNPDPLRSYDARTHVAIKRARLEELLRIELNARGRAA